MIHLALTIASFMFLVFVGLAVVLLVFTLGYYVISGVGEFFFRTLKSPFARWHDEDGFYRRRPPKDTSEPKEKP